MLDFFNVTKEDIDKAKEFKGITWLDGDKPTFQILAVKEKIDNDNPDKSSVTLEMLVCSEKHQGKKDFLYISKKNTSLRVDLLSALFTEEQLLSGQVNQESMLGRKFSCTMKESVTDGKKYINYRNIISAGDDIPLETTKEVPKPKKEKVSREAKRDANESIKVTGMDSGSDLF